MRSVNLIIVIIHSVYIFDETTKSVAGAADFVVYRISCFFIFLEIDKQKSKIGDTRGKNHKLYNQFVAGIEQIREFGKGIVSYLWILYWRWIAFLLLIYNLGIISDMLHIYGVGK